MRKQILLALALIAFAILGISSITKHDNKLKFKDIELKSTKTDLIEVEAERDLLNKKFEDILQSKKLDQEQFKKLQEENKALQEREAELRKQVKAKEAQKLAEAQKLQQTASMSVKAYAASGCGDNEYAREIYMQESGCDITSTNSIGCIGLGQSCPASKLVNACPNWRTDYDCQNRFFTAYAMQYGGWAQAHAFKYCLGSCYSSRTKTTVFKSEIWW